MNTTWFIRAILVIFLTGINISVKAQLGFSHSPLGYSYDSVMSMINQKYRIEQRSSSYCRIDVFYFPQEKTTLYLVFNDNILRKMCLMEEHHLRGKKELRLMSANTELWKEQLHEHETYSSYSNDEYYVEEVYDTREVSNGHTLKIKYPLTERKVIMEAYLSE